jgi:RNA polymerase sigma-70 factor (ECF subfamily)
MHVPQAITDDNALNHLRLRWGTGADMSDPSDLEQLIHRAVEGDDLAASELFSRYRDRLRRMVQLRLDRRLYGRVDASDIIQEATIEAARRLSEYAASPSMDFFLWLRQLTGQKLIDTHRHHLGTHKRNVDQEVSLYRKAMPEATSTALAAQLLGRLTTPTEALRRAELQLQVQTALSSLDPVDREVLVLRNFEHLSNAETAEILGLSTSAASKRFIVALRRLKAQLQNIPGLADRF